MTTMIAKPLALSFVLISMLAMGLVAGQRNLAAAMLVAAQNFSANPNVLVMVMLFGILGLILLMVVGGEMGKHSQPATASTQP